MVGGSAGVIVHGHGVGCIDHRANGLSYPITLIVPGSVGWVKGAVSWDQNSCLDRSVFMPTESPQPANLRASVKDRFGLVATQPDQERKFPVGPESAKRLGYDAGESRVHGWTGYRKSSCTQGALVSGRKP
jgi:hypothetical protein